MLLDTQILLWVLQGSLSEARIQALNSSPVLFYSDASVWELAIKVGVGKLDRAHLEVPDFLARSGVSRLEIRQGHLSRVADLPHHHRDPFDRLLIAQAQVEGMVLLTADRQLEPYGYPVRRI